MFGRKGDTMDTYYEDILKKVEMQMEQHDHQAAYQILEEELSMPYIPKEYEQRLIDLYNACRSELQPQAQRSYSEEDIEMLLKGSLEEQFLAIEQLRKSNIRNHLDAIRDYLGNAPHYLIRSYLIEAMMEQNISDEFTIEMDGLVITFAPCFIEPPMESDGVIQAVAYLKDWFESNNPTFTMMCVETLVKEAYLRLPYNIEEDDALGIAIGVAQYVFAAHEEMDAFAIFLNEKGLARNSGYELLFSKHEI